jgi:hypothetical protein
MPLIFEPPTSLASGVLMPWLLAMLTIGSAPSVWRSVPSSDSATQLAYIIVFRIPLGKAA